MSTITTGDVSDFDISGTEGADDFLAHFLPDGDDDASKKKPSEKGTKEADEASHDEPVADETSNTDEQSDESPDAEGDEGSETDESEAEAKAKKYVEIDDNTFVKVKVGDEEIEVPVKDLTRVHGQEAALTRKSQEVAEARKKATEETSKSLATLDVLLKRAKERAAPFAQIDFLALAKDPNVSAEEMTSLRSLAQTSFDEVRFLEGELGNFMQAIQGKQKEEFNASVKQCIEALSTPGTDDKPNPLHIEGWSQKVYDELRDFAVSTGLNKDVVNTLTDPAAFKIIQMAMMYKKGATKVQTTKVNKSPKKIVKTSNSPVASQQSPSKANQKKAMEKLQRTGTVDDAAEAFLARMTRESDDE